MKKYHLKLVFQSVMLFTIMKISKIIDGRNEEYLHIIKDQEESLLKKICDKYVKGELLPNVVWR